MKIEELVGLVNPPTSPKEIGSPDDRRTIESSVGISLPDDYWEFALAYGSGRFVADNFEFTVVNPFAPSFREEVEWGCESINSLKKSAIGGRVKYNAFPQEDGLFPWGTDIDGNSFYWQTIGPAEEWPIVICPETGDPDEFEAFQMSLIRILHEAIKRNITCRAWQDAEAFSEGDIPRFVQ